MPGGTQILEKSPSLALPKKTQTTSTSPNGRGLFNGLESWRTYIYNTIEPVSPSISIHVLLLELVPETTPAASAPPVPSPSRRPRPRRWPRAAAARRRRPRCRSPARPAGSAELQDHLKGSICHGKNMGKTWEKHGKNRDIMMI